MWETGSLTKPDRPLGARFMGGAGFEVFQVMSAATAAEHLHILLMPLHSTIGHFHYEATSVHWSSSKSINL